MKTILKYSALWTLLTFTGFFSLPDHLAFGASRLLILAGTFPMYLFTANVTSGVEGVTVDLMLPPGLGCPHDYVLTTGDLDKIRRADVFVANGLGLEEFLGEPLFRVNPKTHVLDASSGIDGLLPLHKKADQKTIKSLNPSGDHAHVSAHQHHHMRFNPHLFSSPHMAAEQVKNIVEGLSRLDPEHAATYQSNGSRFGAELRKLANEFESLGKQLIARNVITQHEIFDYLAQDIGLNIIAVIQEEPDQEPSAAEVLNLVKIVREKKVAAIFTEPQYPPKIAQTIASETGIPSVVLDPVATGPDQAPLDYYQKTMLQNLEIIKRTLGHATS